MFQTDYHDNSLPCANTEENTLKMPDRDRSNWDVWITRIPKEESDRLEQLGKILVLRQLVPKQDHYNIGRWALHFALEKLEEEYILIKEKRAQAQATR